ncbi:nucleotidyltransferase domain-containing protein [Coleofasciculus sp.]|uniref:nucleotidyltransferase domain-containing protein n=1 Tax=Coleofasciculus sp. TaxID=3100458 RepID=UPI003A2E84C8
MAQKLINNTVSNKSPEVATHPEFDLLLCCSRTQMDATTAKSIKTLVESNINWAHLIQMADRHGVLPLLYQSLNSTCPEAVPQTILNQLRLRFQTNALYTLFLSEELIKLLNLFETHQIPAIPFKGSVLAASVYGNLALRQFVDIDILVREQDFIKTEALLITQGYQLKLKYDWEQCFVDDNRQVEVDIHQGIAPSYFPFYLDFEGLWQRLQSVPLLETTVVSFSPEDLLLILCVQVAKDCWEKLGRLEKLIKVCDIAQFIQAYPELNWQGVIETARKLGGLRMLYFGLILARDLVGATLPPEIELNVQADSVEVSLAAQVCRNFFDNVNDSADIASRQDFNLSAMMQRFIFYIRIREKLSNKIQYVSDFVRRELM